jgi:hypothetical protein
LRKDIAIGNTVFTVVRNPYSWLVSWWGMTSTSAGLTFNNWLRNVAIRPPDPVKPWPSDKFLFAACWADDGTLMMDRTLRQEHLDVGLRELASQTGITFTPSERVNVGRHRTNYRTYYSPAAVRFVEKHWGRELDLFGYDLDGATMEGPIELHGSHYSWNEDRLWHD